MLFLLSFSFFHIFFFLTLFCLAYSFSFLLFLKCLYIYIIYSPYYFPFFLVKFSLSPSCFSFVFLSLSLPSLLYLSLLQIFPFIYFISYFLPGQVQGNLSKLFVVKHTHTHTEECVILSYIASGLGAFQALKAWRRVYF